MHRPPLAIKYFRICDSLSLGLVDPILSELQYNPPRRRRYGYIICEFIGGEHSTGVVTTATHLRNVFISVFLPSTSPPRHVLTTPCH